MFTYRVLDKQTLELKYQYDAEAPIEWNEYPFANYTHEENPYVPVSVVIPPTPSAPGKRYTRLEFLRRFTQEERIAMMMVADQSYAVRDYIHLLDVAEEVFTDDPVTIGGLQAMEAAGLIGPGRALEILNG